MMSASVSLKGGPNVVMAFGVVIAMNALRQDEDEATDINDKVRSGTSRRCPTQALKALCFEAWS